MMTQLRGAVVFPHRAPRRGMWTKRGRGMTRSTPPFETEEDMATRACAEAGVDPFIAR